VGHLLADKPQNLDGAVETDGSFEPVGIFFRIVFFLEKPLADFGGDDMPW
jgi:hypothetical protein